MPASTSRTPWRTFSGVSRLMRPSSSSSPQSPQVEPGGRCFHRFVTVSSPSRPQPARDPTASRCLYRPVGLHSSAQGTASCAGRSGFEYEIIASQRRKVTTMTEKELVVSADGHILEPTDLFRHPPPEAPAGSGGLGGGLRDRAAGRGRGPDLPAPAHARVRGLDDLPLPPDRRTDARRRPRHDPRGHGLRRGRRPGDASEPVALRALLRRPRAVHGPRPCLQRLRHRAVHARTSRGWPPPPPSRSPTSTTRWPRSSGSPPAGFRAILLPAIPPKPYYSRDFDPVWAAAQANGVHVFIHTQTGGVKVNDPAVHHAQGRHGDRPRRSTSR